MRGHLLHNQRSSGGMRGVNEKTMGSRQREKTTSVERGTPKAAMCGHFQTQVGDPE